MKLSEGLAVQIGGKAPWSRARQQGTEPTLAFTLRQ